MSTNTAEASFHKLQEALVTCQRQALLGAVSAMVAHEFNNLMTPVLARAQDALLRDDVPAMRRALNCTVTQTQRAMEVTRRLMALASRELSDVRICRLSELIDNALIAMVRSLPKDGIELRVEVSDALRVVAQPILFEQVLLNLLLNARAAMKRGGRVAITAFREDQRVIIDISDNGRGISGDRIDHEFNPFFRAEIGEDPCDWHAIGLGLNVCRTIVRSHGASIEVRANDDRGCTFRLSWPTG